jgi:hypothetical protein
MKKIFNFLAKKAKKFTRINLVQKFIHDLGSLRALWNYLFLALYTWIIVYGVVHYGHDCITTAITTTGSLAGWVFVHYVWSGQMDKHSANAFPIPGTSGWAGDQAQAPVGDADNPVVALESPKDDTAPDSDTPAAGGDDNG